MEHVVRGLPGPAVAERVEGPAGPARLGHACAQPPPKRAARRPGGPAALALGWGWAGAGAGAGAGWRGRASRRDPGVCRRPRLCEVGSSEATRGAWGGVFPAAFFSSVLSLSAFKLQDLVSVETF